jgi:hypothetical protein
MFKYERLAERGQSEATREQDFPVPLGPHTRWLLEEFEPGTAAHIIAATARFRRQPDISALKRAFDALTVRYPALHAAFAPPESGPGEGPQFRMRLYTDATETVVRVLAHHAVADVWSMTTLLREFELLYTEQAGQTLALLPTRGNEDLVRLYRWVGGARASVHAAADRGRA